MKNKSEFSGVIPKLVTISADELVAMDLPPIRMVVGDIIPAGLLLLAGDPKVGKSLLMQHLAVCVATGQDAWGHFPVDAGDVLYLANEGGLRSFRERLVKMMQGEKPPARLAVCTTSDESLGARLEYQIESWLVEATDPRLVIIDTYSSVAPEGRGVNRHQDDYNALAGLADLGTRFPDTLLSVVHHTNKSDGETDIMHRISGSQGMTAATDGNAVLTRSPAANRCRFAVRPRNAEESDLILERNPNTLTWTVIGDDERAQLSTSRKQVLDWLEQNGAASPKEIAEGTSLSHDSTRQLLPEMVRSQQLIKCGRGKYSIPGDTAAMAA